MNTHTRRSQAGFSFVELLVTIIIAGIAFAAMVPVFLSAQEKNSADEVRNIALNLAQQKIEQIRQLDWSQIEADEAHPSSLPNLYNSSFAGGDFGPTWTTDRGRSFNVDYQVEDVASPTVAGVTAYKAVTVTVSWQPPPSPVKSVRITTFVYRQYSGAKITTLKAAPLDRDWHVPDAQVPAYLPDDSETVDDWPGYIFGPTKLTATTDSPAEFVTFYVYSGDGSEITASLQVMAPNSNTTTFETPLWTPPAGMDGWYFFTAVATAGGYSGNTMQQPYYVETGPPLAPTGLTAVTGDGTTLLTWTRTASPDLSHYNVYRGTTSGAETLLASNVDAEAYEDDTAVNGTMYFYRVTAVDILGKESPRSDAVSVIPNSPADKIPPTPPSGLTASVAGPAVTLSWIAATDDRAVAGYLIYRDKDLTSEIGRVGPGALSFTDLDAGYSATHTYTVLAYDTSANKSGMATLLSGSGDAGWLPVTTLAHKSYTLKVATNQNNVAVTAYNIDEGTLYTAPKQATRNNPAVFNAPMLPSGTYIVTAKWAGVSHSMKVDVFSEPTTTRIDF